ncbi:unnamed protein product [Clonostachys rosea]|uniref:GST C-terminal domain-containing protein n=1 Tax=Bionectria ochroleuca TaxID=29856 RepID=A0ABY6UWL6_BIOOC|nr:unnamed protein product [Clonostachys rosea]
MSSQSTVPVFHYLELGRLGRGEVLNLFLKDAGVDFKEIRYPYDETWPAQSKKLQKEGITKTGLLPALEYKGSIYTQARDSYIPSSSTFTSNFIASISLLCASLRGSSAVTMVKQAKKNILWMLWQISTLTGVYVAQWVAALKGVTNEYKNEFLPKYYAQIAQYYSQNKGPYLLGDKITYVDFAVYQSIDNDLRIGSLPLPSKLPDELVQLIETINRRPNIAQYLEKNKFTPA